MNTNFHTELPTFTVHILHSSSYVRIQCFDNIHNPLLYTQLAQGPPQYLPWYSVKRFLQVYKCYPQILLLLQKSFLYLPEHEYCISGTFTRSETKLHVIELNFTPQSCLQDALKKTFITWSSNLIPL